MKSNRREKRIRISVIALLFILMLAPCMGNAAIPQKINYQGYLTNASGVPINGTLQMTFKIYDVATGGIALWTEVHSVAVDKGVYNVFLGEGTPPIPINLTFDAQYYLGSMVGTDPEMTPRVPLTSVGYAFRAQTAESVGSHTHSGADISSGTVAEPRIDSAIARTSALTAHSSDTSNPHSTTATQVGAAPTVHNHSGGDITSGTVSEPRIDTAIARTSALSAHTSNTSNPHSTTAVQVGAAPTVHAHSGGDVTTGTVAEARIDGAIARTSALSAHTSNTSNPHSTTAVQVGAAPTVHVHSGIDITTGTVAEARIDSAIARTTALTAHTSNTFNPHSTTAAQVGAAPTVHNHSGGDITTGTVDEARIDAAIARTSALSAHTSNTSNPHSTTAAQIGGVALNQVDSIGANMIVNGAVTDAKITGPISSSKISSTGLNADTLDSLDSSAFALAVHNHDAAYVNQAGDTMSGNLVVNVAGSSAAVRGYTTGTATAGNFQIDNASNTVSAVYSSTNGSGNAVYGLMTGTGRAGNFQINNPSNSFSALYGATNGSGPGIYGYTTGTGRAGLFSISNPSNSVPAISAVTNGSGPASAGTTTGTGHAGYFQIDNASNTVAALYATTNGSGAAGYFDGNVVVAGNLTYNTPKRRFWSVKGSEFIPFDETNTYSKAVNSGLSGTGSYTAPVHLPHGAAVTKFKVYYYDNLVADFTVRLDRSNMSIGIDIMAEASTTGASIDYRTVESTTISNNIIDNSQYGYAVWVTLSGNDHKLGGVVIEYTVTDPLP